MEQAVTERSFSQNQHTNQRPSWHNGAMDNRGTPLQDPSHSRGPSTCWEKTNVSSSSYNGEHIRESKGRAVCRDNLRGMCTRGLFCKFLHADFDDNDLRNTHLFSENKDGDSEKRDLIRKFGGKSLCRNFQSGRCERGSSCAYFHPETNANDSSRRPFFREARQPCRNFQNGRCNRGSTCLYLHHEYAESDRPMHDWTASGNSRFHEENVDKNLKTSMVHDAFNKENNSRNSYSREPRSRSPCRNFLQGRCHFGDSCRRFHPVNTNQHNWSAEQQPMVVGNLNNHDFSDEHSALSSHKHDDSHRHTYLRTGSFSGERSSGSPCQYFRRGSCYQGQPSENSRPVTVYEKRNYDMGSRHHQGVAATSRDHRFDTGNVVREVNCHAVRLYQDTRAGCNVSLNDAGVNTYHKAWSTKENINVDSSGWSSERKRSRPASDFGGNPPQPEVCLKFTKGRCLQGENCRYLHSFHEYASSISQQRQKPHSETSEDLMNNGQANQCAESADTMVVHTHDTSRDVKMQSDERQHAESNLISGDNFFDKENTRKSADDVVTPNTVNQNGVELAEGTENISLWSPPFKRRRFCPEGNVPYETLRRDNYHRSRWHHESQNQYPNHRSFKWTGPANRTSNGQHLNVAATSLNAFRHGDTDSSRMAPNRNRCNHTDKKAMELVTDCVTVEKSLESDSTISLEKRLISEANTAAVGLGNHETDGVKVDLNPALNENTEEPEHIVKAYSMKKRIKQHPSSCKCDAELMLEEVTDTKSQSLPISSSVGGASLDHKNVASVSVVSDNISTSVPQTDDMEVVLASDHPKQGSEVAAVKVQKTMMESSSAATGEVLLGDTDNSVAGSQLSDGAILKSKRKLLVLDVNGLLADIVVDFPDRCKPDTTVGGKGVFKRPFCDDFLQFCFEKFDVGIWSSRTKKNVTMVLDCLMEKTKDKLLFCWHQSHCTQTGYNTVENKEKPLVLKELKKLWEKEEDDLPWKKGFYDETNTILLDDSPYKALRNPPYTAIFPSPYSFYDVKDKSLGPDGDLRLYLERLAEAENVQKFIRENPFGQRHITKTNLSWTFYSKIVGQYTST